MDKGKKIYTLILCGSIGLFMNQNSYCEIYAREENKVVFHIEEEALDSRVNTLPLFAVKEKKFESDLIEAFNDTIGSHQSGNGFWNKGEYSCGDNFYIFYSDEFRFYDQAGVFQAENGEADNNATFLEGEECIDRIGQILSQLGISEEFIYTYHSISAENLKHREEVYVENKLLEKEDKKRIWTAEDDAYLIYGYQKIVGMPVLHSHMAAENFITFDMPMYAPVQAIYSTRGIEYLRIADVYETDFLNKSDNVISLEAAMEAVRKKFSDIPSDSVYEIENARLCEKVFFDQKQELEMQPVWYFEVTENDKNRTVTLINAFTGEEE